jgi:hypothetical protein
VVQPDSNVTVAAIAGTTARQILSHFIDVLTYHVDPSRTPRANGR